jgi:hypothetical protein
VHHTKVYHCFYCGAKIFFDDNVRSEKTNKRLPLNIEDSTRHECAAYAALKAERKREPEKTFFGK